MSPYKIDYKTKKGADDKYAGAINKSLNHTIKDSNRRNYMLIKLDKEITSTTNVGVVTMGKLPDGAETLVLHGFAGITSKEHIILRDDGNILTLEIAPDEPLERCVVFNAENLRHHILLEYFKEFSAIGVLFVRVGNTYIQCKGVKVKLK